ncbi:hypothetical protein M885DRAFT_220687 [Pelagophyceae sp. CCMP2097]|nr:hypothetical protein M885DRAFT_220687 [Pelagophyceae sp. CCMP2097]
MRLWAALRLATFAAAWDGREGGQRFVVSKGCPQALDADAEVRVFVAVPSAAGNFRRRQWIRSTWCRSQPISGASLAAAFFVGRLADEAAIRFEAATYGDVVQVPSWDGMDNVTAKQVHSFRYFASLHGDAIAAPGEDAAWADQRGPTFPTHYMRAEDDVYLNVGGILADLFKRRVDALPGPPRALRNGAELLWASMVTEGAAHPYPAGSAFVLSHRLARALAAAHRVSPYDVGASAPPHCDAAAPNATARCKPPHGKGGFTSDGAWSTDDAFVGRMLFAFAFETINDRRRQAAPAVGQRGSRGTSVDAAGETRSSVPLRRRRT